MFDEIVADLKLQHILTHQEVTQPLAVRPLAENEQISMFDRGRPSVMEQLAVKNPAEKTKPVQTVPKKSHAQEI